MSRQTAVLEGGGLQVRFELREDRYAHGIAVLGASGWLSALKSIEGTPEDHWPPSPPWQSLHLEQRGERQLALLVGMAGKSHWSASVELDPTAKRVTFDIACRVRGGEPGTLGSAYLRHGPCDIVDGALHCRADAGGPWLRIVPSQQFGEVGIRSTPDGWSIRPLDPSTSGASTVRWVYVVELDK